MATTGRNSEAFMLRLADGLRDRLKDIAAENNRSMTAEINIRLEASFSASTAVHPEITRLLDQHIEAEVSARLRKIAASIGGVV